MLLPIVEFNKVGATRRQKFFNRLEGAMFSHRASKRVQKRVSSSNILGLSTDTGLSLEARRKGLHSCSIGVLPL